MKNKKYGGYESQRLWHQINSYRKALAKGFSPEFLDAQQTAKDNGEKNFVVSKEFACDVCGGTVFITTTRICKKCTSIRLRKMMKKRWSEIHKITEHHKHCDKK